MGLARDLVHIHLVDRVDKEKSLPETQYSSWRPIRLTYLTKTVLPFLKCLQNGRRLVTVSTYHRPGTFVRPILSDSFLVVQV